MNRIIVAMTLQVLAAPLFCQQSMKRCIELEDGADRLRCFDEVAAAASSDEQPSSAQVESDFRRALRQNDWDRAKKLQNQLDPRRAIELIIEVRGKVEPQEWKHILARAARDPHAKEMVEIHWLTPVLWEVARMPNRQDLMVTVLTMIPDGSRDRASEYVMGRMRERLRVVQSGGTDPNPAPRGIATKSKYDRLSDGMSYGQAVAILGGAGEQISRSTLGGIETVMYSWTNPDGSNLNATFQNGKLVQKAQSGLR